MSIIDIYCRSMLSGKPPPFPVVLHFGVGFPLKGGELKMKACEKRSRKNSFLRLQTENNGPIKIPNR